VEDAQRQRDQAEEQHQRKVRAEDEARLRRLDEARRCEHETRQREEDARKEEEESRLRMEEPEGRPIGASDTGEPVFDPHLVLGVAPHSTEQQLRTAFEEARSKYDPEQVSHLGVDVQEHFAEKSRAVERAYRMLAGDVDAPAPGAGGELNPADELVS
jgi:DnaJ-domain-containing protein 1